MSSFIYTTDDIYRPADSSGNIIMPTGMSLYFGTYGTATAYFNYYVEVANDYSSATMHARISVGSSDLNTSSTKSSGGNRQDLDLRFTFEVSTDDFKTIQYSTVITEPARWYRQAEIYIYERSNISNYVRSVNNYGMYLNIGNDIALPVKNTEYKVRFRNIQYRKNSTTEGTTSWASATSVDNQRVYSSYAPFVLSITKPSKLYLNGLNIFKAKIDARMISTISYSSTTFTQSKPVRTETAPYINTGETTENIYFCPSVPIRTNTPETPLFGTYSLNCKLDVIDPSDSDFIITVSKSTVTGDEYFQAKDDFSMYSVTFSHEDPSGLYNKYGYLLRNTGSVLRARADFKLKYGVYANFVCSQNQPQSKITDLYSGYESGTAYFDNNLDGTYSTIKSAMRMSISTQSDGSYKLKELEETFNVLNYYVPSFPNLAVHRCDEDGSANDNGDHCRIEWAVNIFPIAGQNSKTLIIIQPAGTTEYNPLDSYTQSGVLIVPASTESAYTITFTAEDDLNSETRQITLSSAGVIMDWLYGGKGVAFGKVASEKLAIEVSEMWKLICYKLLLSGVDVEKWLKELTARLDGIEQFASNLGSTDQYQVTFYNDSEILNRQWVISGNDAIAPDETPEREATESTAYSFAGWALTNGKTTADANALKNITSYRSVYAAFSETIRYYSVFYYNKATLLQTVTDIQYHQSASYSGDTPVDEDGKTFVGFSPTGNYIEENTICNAVFYDDTEIEDDWDTIIAACADKTFDSKYKVGQYKPVDMGTEGIINMRCVGMKMDRLTGGNMFAPMTWIADSALNTSHRYNPGLSSRYENVPIDSWEIKETRSSGSISYMFTSQNKGENSVAYGKFTVHFKPLEVSEGGYWSIRLKQLGSTEDDDELVIKANGETIISWKASTGPRSDYAFSRVKEPTDYEIELIFTCSTNTTSANLVILEFYTANIVYAGDITKLDVVENRETTRRTLLYNEGTGSIGGWEKSELRVYMETLKEKLPANVRAGIKKVRKYSDGMTESLEHISNAETDDDLWVPSRAELFGYYEYEYRGPEYAANKTTRTKKKGSSSLTCFSRSVQNSSVNRAMASGTVASYVVSMSAGVIIGFCT